MQWCCAAEGRKIMPEFIGVSHGGTMVLPVLSFTLSLPLGSGRGTETFQLKAFKLTVCKLFKSTQIYWKKGQFLLGSGGAAREGCSARAGEQEPELKSISQAEDGSPESIPHVSPDSFPHGLIPGGINPLIPTKAGF